MPSNKRNNNNNNSSRKGGNRNAKFYKNGRQTNNSNRNCTEFAPSQDPYWYAKDAKAIEAFASLPFVNVNGNPITNYEFTANPGIFVFPYLPTVPGADSASTSNYATRAADAYYQSIAQGFSANFDFEAPDLLMLEIAATGLFAFLKEGRRAYGAMKLYLQNNAYWAEKIVDALGFNFSNMKANLKEFVAQYNLRVEAINKIIAAPRAFFIAQRWAYLSENIFTDATPLDYATTYAYRMRAVPEYSGTLLNTGTCVSYLYQSFTERYTVSSYFAVVDRLLSSLTGDDQRQMFGAIRRVYSSAELITMEPLDSSFAVTVYDSEVQSIQLHNTTLFIDADGFTTDTLGEPEYSHIMMYQGAGGMVMAKYFGYLAGSTAVSQDWRQQILSICGGDDSPEKLLDYTADMVPWGDAHDSARPGISYIYPRAEIIFFPYVTTLQETKVVSPYHKDVSMMTTIQNLALFARLNRAPHQYVYTTSEYGYYPVELISELDKYTIVHNTYLRSLNTKCAYNLLALPLFDKSVT